MLIEWMKNESIVKNVFDHFRNFFISGAVFYAGLYALQSSSAYRGGQVLGIITAIALCLLALVLFIVNIIQAVKLVIMLCPGQPMTVSHKVQMALIFLFYFLCALQIVDSVYKPKLSHAADWRQFAENKKDGLKINLDMDSITSPRKGVLRIWEERLPGKNRWKKDTGAFWVRTRSLKEINCADRSIKIIMQKEEDSKSSLPTIREDMQPYFIEPNTPDEALHKLLCKK